MSTVAQCMGKFPVGSFHPTLGGGYITSTMGVQIRRLTHV